MNDLDEEAILDKVWERIAEKCECLRSNSNLCLGEKTNKKTWMHGQVFLLEHSL